MSPEQVTYLLTKIREEVQSPEFAQYPEEEYEEEERSSKKIKLSTSSLVQVNPESIPMHIDDLDSLDTLKV